MFSSISTNGADGSRTRILFNSHRSTVYAESYKNPQAYCINLYILLYEPFSFLYNHIIKYMGMQHEMQHGF